MKATFLPRGTVEQAADSEANKHHGTEPHVDKGHDEGTKDEAG